MMCTAGVSGGWQVKRAVPPVVTTDMKPVNLLS